MLAFIYNMNDILKNYVIYLLLIPVVLLFVVANRYSKKLEDETAKETEDKLNTIKDKIQTTKEKVNYIKHVREDSVPIFTGISAGLFFLKRFKKDYKKPKRKSVVSSLFKAYEDYNRKYKK